MTGYVVQVAELGVPYILMHMRGDPATMQSRENTSYEDVCTDVGRELQAAADAAMSSGIEPWRLILDPGGSFGSTTITALYSAKNCLSSAFILSHEYVM